MSNGVGYSKDLNDLITRWEGREFEILDLHSLLDGMKDDGKLITVSGLPSSGKTSIVADYLATMGANFVVVNCEVSSSRMYVAHSILSSLANNLGRTEVGRKPSRLNEFIATLSLICAKLHETESLAAPVIVLKNGHALRKRDPEFWRMLITLPTRLNYYLPRPVSVIVLSREHGDVDSTAVESDGKWCGLPTPPQVYFAPPTITDIETLLLKQLPSIGFLTHTLPISLYHPKDIEEFYRMFVRIVLKMSFLTIGPDMSAQASLIKAAWPSALLALISARAAAHLQICQANRSAEAAAAAALAVTSMDDSVPSPSVPISAINGLEYELGAIHTYTADERSQLLKMGLIIWTRSKCRTQLFKAQSRASPCALARIKYIDWHNRLVSLAKQKVQIFLDNPTKTFNPHADDPYLVVASLQWVGMPMFALSGVSEVETEHYSDAKKAEAQLLHSQEAVRSRKKIAGGVDMVIVHLEDLVQDVETRMQRRLKPKPLIPHSPAWNRYREDLKRGLDPIIARRRTNLSPQEVQDRAIGKVISTLPLIEAQHIVLEHPTLFAEPSAVIDFDTLEEMLRGQAGGDKISIPSLNTSSTNTANMLVEAADLRQLPLYSRHLIVAAGICAVVPQGKDQKVISSLMSKRINTSRTMGNVKRAKAIADVQQGEHNFSNLRGVLGAARAFTMTRMLKIHAALEQSLGVKNSDAWTLQVMQRLRGLMDVGVLRVQGACKEIDPYGCSAFTTQEVKFSLELPWAAVEEAARQIRLKLDEIYLPVA